jgi:hypothetical protein
VPGPAPKPDGARRRRNAPRANTVKLPADGRKGAPPEWPLSGDAPSIWSGLWATPQAAAWERLGWTRVVARYCRVASAAEAVDASAAVLAQAVALEDRLGLTPMSMLRLRWEVTTDEVAEVRELAAPVKKSRALKVVDDAVARPRV